MWLNAQEDGLPATNVSLHATGVSLLVREDGQLALERNPLLL